MDNWVAVRKKPQVSRGSRVPITSILVVPTGWLGSPQFPQKPSDARLCARLHGYKFSDRPMGYQYD